MGKKKTTKKKIESDSEYDCNDEEYFEEDEELSFDDDNSPALRGKKGKKIKRKSTKQKENSGKGISLKVLTPQFEKLIKSQKDHKINFNDAKRKLGVIKRRIYDMTNSL